MEHESTSGGETHTGGGASVGGNIDAGRDFTGRDKANVNVNVYPPKPPRQRRPATEQLSGITMAEANALWESLNRLSEAVGGLKSSIETNTRETGKLADAIDDTREKQQEQFRVIDKTILTLQTGLSELGLTPKSQREPRWKTNVLVGSTAVIAVCVLLGLAYLMFGGG